MLTTTYGQAQLMRVAAFLGILIMLGLTGYKLYASFLKAQDYAKATAFLKENDLILADEYFLKASENTWIQYKETEIAEGVEKLKPIAEIKVNLLAIRKQGEAKDDPYNALPKAYAGYQASKKAAASKGAQYNVIFDDLSSQYEMSAYFKAAFAEYKTDLNKQFESDIQKKSFSDTLVASYLNIPEEFAENVDKRYSMLEAYDNGRIDHLSESKTFADVLDEGERLLANYEKLNIEPEWLLRKIGQISLAHLEDLMAKSDLPALFKDAKIYQARKALVGQDTAVSSYVQAAYNEQAKMAEKLGNDKQFEKAIQLYKLLSGYQDTSKQIQNMELKWTASEPMRLLQKAIPGKTFSAVIHGKDKFGALIYSAGIADGKLVLVRLLSDMSIDKKEAALGQNLRAPSIKFGDNLSVAGAPVLVVEDTSSSRRARYAAYEVGTSALKKLFDFEADGYTVDKKGTLLVDNAVGDGASQLAFYEYKNGEYQFASIKPDYADITLKDLLNYHNKKVRFTCEIFTADGDTAVVLYNEEFILLLGQPGLKPGKAVITGTWVGNDVVKKGAQDITTYMVNVSSAVQ